MNKYISLLFKVHIHPVLWGIAGLSVVTAQFKPLILLFVIVFFHEMGHAVCARFFSWRVKSIMLLPFGGVVEVDEHGNRPLKEEFWVILSGPLQHIPLQLIGWFLFAIDWISYETFVYFTWLNASILLFNLLPIWPLDGGKLFLLWRSANMSYPNAHRQVLVFSFYLLCLICFVTVIFHPTSINLWLILSFIGYSLYMENKHKQYVYLRFLMERYYGKNEAVHALKPIEVKEDDELFNVLMRFQRGCKHPIIVEQHDGKVQLDETELLHAYFTHKQTNARMKELLYVY